MPFPIFRRNIQQPATPTAPAAAAALSAAIAQSAAAPVQQTAALSILGNPTTATTTATSLTLTSGITFSGTTSVGIAPFGITTGVLNTASVTYAKIQTESASTLLGNPTTASATVSEITLGTGLAFSGSMLISTVTGGGSGTVTQIDTGTGLTGGPITAAGTVSVAAFGITTGLLATSSVTYPKIQAETALTLLGNPTTASATVSEITLGGGLAFTGSTLTCTVTGGGGTGTVTQIDTGTGLTGGPITAAGTVSIATSGVTTGLIANAAVTYAKIQNVAAVSLLGNPTTASATVSEITLGSGLAFSGTTLVASGSAGALTLLEQHTAATSASLVFTTSITSTYDEYMIEFVNMVPATDNVNAYLRFSINGGSTYDTSSIYDQGSGVDGSGNFSANSGTLENQGQILICSGQDNSASSSLQGSMKLFSPLGSQYKQGTWLCSFLANDTHYYNIHGGFRYRSTASVSAFQFIYSTGSVSSGTIRVYGLSK